MADVREAGVAMVLVGFPRRNACSAKCLLVQGTNLALAMLAVTIFWIIVNGDQENASLRQLAEQHAGIGRAQQELEQEIAARKQQLQDEMCRIRSQHDHPGRGQDLHVDSQGRVSVGDGDKARKEKTKKSKSKRSEKKNREAKKPKASV